jgi:ferredoxin
VVDLTRCQGYGQCVFAAPEVFRMHGDEALAYQPNPGDEQREKVVRAAAACPVRAIVLEDRAGTPAAGAVGMERIVIVGASLAGLRAAHTLRREGFTGSLTLIGDEPYEPYDRIPLSKQVLTGWVPPQRTALPRSGGLNADWRLGQPAVALDRRAKRVLLADGEQVPFDRC